MHLFIQLLFAVVTPCSSQAGFDASRLSTELPPVPVWPSDGRHPAERPDQHVFLDEKTREVVVSIPARPPSAGTNVLERQQLAIGICPSVSQTVTKTRDADRKQDTYLYSYAFANAPSAKQALRAVTFGVPLAGPSLTVAGPHDWGSDVWESTANNLVGLLRQEKSLWGQNQQDRIEKMATRSRIRWFAKLSNFNVPAGGSLKSFSIGTIAKPGIIDAYFIGAAPPISTQEQWDPAVSGQLASLGLEENNSVSMPIVGPKFTPDATHEAIAKDYIASIGRLIKEGKLSAESPFIREATSSLTVLAGSGSRRISSTVRSKPMPGLESDIALGIKLSLE